MIAPEMVEVLMQEPAFAELTDFAHQFELFRAMGIHGKELVYSLQRFHRIPDHRRINCGGFRLLAQLLGQTRTRQSASRYDNAAYGIHLDHAGLRVGCVERGPSTFFTKPSACGSSVSQHQRVNT